MRLVGRQREQASLVLEQVGRELEQGLGLEQELELLGGNVDAILENELLEPTALS